MKKVVEVRKPRLSMTVRHWYVRMYVYYWSFQWFYELISIKKRNVKCIKSGIDFYLLSNIEYIFNRAIFKWFQLVLTRKQHPTHPTHSWGTRMLDALMHEYKCFSQWWLNSPWINFTHFQEKTLLLPLELIFINSSWQVYMCVKFGIWNFSNIVLNIFMISDYCVSVCQSL